MKTKNFIIGLFSLAVLSCNNTPNSDTTVGTLPALEAGPMVVNSKVSGYEIYAGKSVARVQTQLSNTGNTALVNYIVSLKQDDMVYSDTVLVELHQNDTVKTEVIFTEVTFKEDENLPITHELQLLNP
ncbi:MAG: hypothetical protein LAT76_04810 [Schleiferiaceae bacterium]|nr:hypothetical protein [Schleiferiaceae bacterium]